MKRIITQTLMVITIVSVSMTSFASIEVNSLKKSNISPFQANNSMKKLANNHQKTPALSLKTQPSTMVKNTPIKIESISYQPVATPTEVLSVNKQQRIKQATKDNRDFAPLCPSLSTDTLYTLTDTQTGGTYCYHFNIPVRSKTMVLLTGQNINTDFGLYLFKDDGANNLTLAGASDYPGNVDEFFKVLTESGDYYWYMQANASDGSGFQFAAIPNTQIDSYEPNDTLATATLLADKINNIEGNLDSSTDQDYYAFTAIRGQDLMITFEDADDYTKNINWAKIQLLNGGEWVTLDLSPNDLYHSFIKISGLQANQTVYIRVLPTNTNNVDPNKRYYLRYGSKPTSFRSGGADGEYNVLRIPFGAVTPYLTTQAYKKLSLGIFDIRDSKDAFIDGATVVFWFNKDSLNDPLNEYASGVTRNGNWSKTLDIGSCYGEYATRFYDYPTKSTWETRFNAGYWVMEVIGGRGDVGIGGGTGNTAVTFGHLCSQRIVK